MTTERVEACSLCGDSLDARERPLEECAVCWECFTTMSEAAAYVRWLSTMDETKLEALA